MATTIYISPSGDNSDGTTWAKAYTSLAAASACATDALGGHRTIVAGNCVYTDDILGTSPLFAGTVGAHNHIIFDCDETYVDNDNATHGFGKGVAKLRRTTDGQCINLIGANWENWDIEGGCFVTGVPSSSSVTTSVIVINSNGVTLKDVVARGCTTPVALAHLTSGGAPHKLYRCVFDSFDNDVNYTANGVDNAGRTEVQFIRCVFHTGYNSIASGSNIYVLPTGAYGLVTMKWCTMYNANGGVVNGNSASINVVQHRCTVRSYYNAGGNPNPGITPVNTESTHYGTGSGYAQYTDYWDQGFVPDFFTFEDTSNTGLTDEAVTGEEAFDFTGASITVSNTCGHRETQSKYIGFGGRGIGFIQTGGGGGGGGTSYENDGLIDGKIG